MRVVVASHNPVKIRAVESAFSAQFPELTIESVPVAAESGVGEQPRSDGETRRGAVNRANHAFELQADAAFWVGLEGGIEVIDGQLIAFAWMAVRNDKGKIGEARTVTLPLPPAIQTLVDQGMELGEANDQVFATMNSKQKGGAFGLLTGGLYTRESVYAEAVVMALVPFVSELFPP